MKLVPGVALAVVSFVLVACGPSVQGDGNGNGSGADGGTGNIDGGGTGECAAFENNCGDGRDNDCDGFIDCGDPDCGEFCVPPDAGVCGEASYGGEALAIPDGVGMSYETTMDIQGFDPGQTLGAVSDIVSVCVVMEHSWLRDLQMEILCPSGQLVVLNEFLGQTGGEVYMGVPNDDDSFDPVPGTGGTYCWTPTATNPPMLEWANANPLAGTLPEGDYQASGSWDPFIGCDMNGLWMIRVTDDWGIDNGYIFEWSMEFNSDIISDCEGWDPIP